MQRLLIQVENYFNITLALVCMDRMCFTLFGPSCFIDLEWKFGKELNHQAAVNGVLEGVPDDGVSTLVQVMLMQSLNMFYFNPFISMNLLPQGEIVLQSFSRL